MCIKCALGMVAPKLWLAIHKSINNAASPEGSKGMFPLRGLEVIDNLFLLGSMYVI